LYRVITVRKNCIIRTPSKDSCSGNNEPCQ